MAQVYKNCNDLIAHLEGVKGAAVDAAAPILGRARAIHAAHRDTGNSSVNLVLGHKTDAYVALDDPDGNALAIEKGHFNPEGEFVDGIHCLRDAVQAGE